MDASILSDHFWQGCCGTALFNLLVFLFLIFYSLYLLLKFLGANSNLNLPPSPTRLPVIGNLHQIDKLLHRSLQTLSEKHGPLILLHLGSVPAIIVSSVEIAREILRHDIAFSDRPQIRAADVLFHGCSDIAFSSYGDYWRQAKKICVLELLSQKRVMTFGETRKEEVAKMVEKIRISCVGGTVIDLQEMFTRISNDILCRCAFGRTYDDGKEANRRFGELSRTAIDLTGAFCFKDTFPFLAKMDILTGLSARLEEASRALNDFLDLVIEEHLVQKSSEVTFENKDLVDILLQVQKEPMLGIDLTRDNLKSILLDMFIGGTDTTGTSMEWAMAELVKNPNAMQKVQEEVRRIVGQKPTMEESDIEQMHFLKCVLKEALRLHTPALVVRQTSASAKLDGYDIPPKALVFINTWAIQRDPKVWENPEEFTPDRFANTSVDLKGHHCQFIPFGAGRRNCPGISFAVVEAEYVLANLLYWFDWELPEGTTAEDLDMSDIYTPVIRKKEPLRLKPVSHFPDTHE